MATRRRARAIQFRLVQKTNKFKSVKSYLTRPLAEKNNMAETYAKFIRVKARSLMKPAPKNPRQDLGRYGRSQAYTPQAYARRLSKGKTETHFWRKGLYSKPGDAPFYHKANFNLRRIEYKEVSSGQVTHPSLRLRTNGVPAGLVKGYIVGPMYKPNKLRTSIPALHEFGGMVRLPRTATDTYTGRNGAVMRYASANNAFTKGTVTYPARPYMKPAGILGKQEADRKFNKYTHGRIRATTTWSFAA